VAPWHARTKASDTGPPPSRSASTAAVAAGDSGASRIDVTRGPARSAPPVRVAASSSTGKLSSRFGRNSRNRADAPSDQCRSSTTSSCGRCSASAATSQYSLWRTPNDASGSAEASGSTTGPASAAAPASVRLRVPADIPRSRGSKSWRTTPQAYDSSSSDPRPTAVAKPRSLAASRTCPRTLVFPRPAAPSRITVAPRPPAAALSASRMTASSCSRSWSRTNIWDRESMAARRRPQRRSHHLVAESEAGFQLARR
jgi:hypothetical protein